MIVKTLDSAQLPIAYKFYQQFNKAMKPRKSDRVWCAYQGLEVIGAVRCRHIGAYPLLTGLLVAPNARNQGVGLALCLALRNEVTEPVYLFCQPELAPFYARAGFCQPSTLPAEINHKLGRLKGGYVCMVASASAGTYNH